MLHIPYFLDIAVILCYLFMLSNKENGTGFVYPPKKKPFLAPKNIKSKFAIFRQYVNTIVRQNMEGSYLTCPQIWLNSSSR
jgi:hypothetical protein